MTRPDIGTVKGASSFNDESYLDFVEGMRAFNLSRMMPQYVKAGDELGAMLSTQQGATPQDLFRKLGEVPVAQAARRMMRSTQNMMWYGTQGTYGRNKQALMAWLDKAEAEAPHLLHVDPDFKYPEYIRAQDIHLQPGSYQDDDLAGFVFQYGSKIFFTGGNDNDKLHNVMAAWVPVGENPKRIVDFGCGVGQSTTAFKERFPDAEVHGIDVGGPMLRYAHARAHDLGVEVHFTQADASNTAFEDNSVDAVMAMILFHEVPPETARGIVAEAARILKPGGTFTIIDFPLVPEGEMSGRHCVRLFDSWYNGEPFAPGFVYSDFTGLLREHFAEVDPDYRPAATSTGALAIRVCRKAA